MIRTCLTFRDHFCKIISSCVGDVEGGKANIYISETYTTTCTHGVLFHTKTNMILSY